MRLGWITASELGQLDYEVMDAAVRAGRPNEAWARLEESKVGICVEGWRCGFAESEMIKKEDDLYKDKFADVYDGWYWVWLKLNCTRIVITQPEQGVPFSDKPPGHAQAWLQAGQVHMLHLGGDLFGLMDVDVAVSQSQDTIISGMAIGLGWLGGWTNIKSRRSRRFANLLRQSVRQWWERGGCSNASKIGGLFS